MKKTFAPINPKMPCFWHGGDYNPDQWKHIEGIWEEDMRLANLAHVNTFTVGMFQWTSWEPKEGVFDFAWSDKLFDMIAKNKCQVIIGTPSGARPAWLAEKYPEVRRVTRDGVRQPFHGRHNHCASSPIYREKVSIINEKLAERYGKHEAFANLWHLSNEYNGECFCDLCIKKWQEWLQKKYSTRDNLTDAWWAKFWSHEFTDWSQIRNPDSSIDGMVLDWKRFTTDLCIEFINVEKQAIRKHSDAPVTTNMMGVYCNALNQWEVAKHLDVVCWDSYPKFRGTPQDYETASLTSMSHEIYRSYKSGKPWLLMESSPGPTNWTPTPKAKRENQLLTESLQAVAHGSDSVLYFQYRKGRGSHEKYHGAIVDHVGHENTRMFKEVTKVGEALQNLSPVIGAVTDVEVALIYDWENRWAIETSCGPRTGSHGFQREYLETCESHYRTFWQKGVAVDLISMDCDFSKYKLIIAPMLYSIRSGFKEKLEQFVYSGGTFVTTYLSGWVDEYNRCFLGGFPGPMKDVLGIWSEEMDSLYDDEHNLIVTECNNMLGIKGTYKASTYCELIHLTTAEIIATYGKDFYCGRPAVTENSFGNGVAYYIASRNEQSFQRDFYTPIIHKLNLKRAWRHELPEGVLVRDRIANGKTFKFMMNFSPFGKTVHHTGSKMKDIITGDIFTGDILMASWGTRVLVDA